MASTVRPAPLAAPDRPGLAIGLVVTVTMVFVTMDALAKVLTETGMAPESIMTFRYAIVLTALAPWTVYHWKDRPLATSRPWLHVARGVLLIGTATTFVYALKYLPLEVATAIGFASPLYVTILSVPFLGEKVGMRRWMAVVLGFGGVLLILRPGGENFHWAMLLPLVTSLCWASSLIITRAMRGTERPMTVMIWSTGAGFLAILPFGIVAFEPPTGEQWVYLIVVAACNLAAQYLMIRAYMMAAASILAPFSYFTLLWATLVGVFIFGSVPDWLTIIGASVLAGSGLYVWHRERMAVAKTAAPVSGSEPA